MGLKEAFDYLLSKHERAGKLDRPNSGPAMPAQNVDIKYSPTRQSRNLEGPSDSVFKGLEFIVTSTNLAASGFSGPIRRGDRLIDSELGTMTVKEVNYHYGLGAEIIGYRLGVDR